MKKDKLWFPVVVIVIVIVAVGGYMLFHKSAPANPSAGSANPAVASVDNSVLKTNTVNSIGTYLTDSKGNALYTNGSNTSDCVGSCLTAWPAYEDTAISGQLPENVNVVKRNDNQTEQYTYKGLPLYYFASDQNGSVTGNNVGGFVVARP